VTVIEVSASDVARRRSLAKQLRASAPRSSHAAWEPSAVRADPVEILLAQDRTRLSQLVPVRHARMSESPFAFFRGSAEVMAADLVDTPTTGLTVQLCGDAHLANFGSYASPERRQVFDINDFDETLPGPWEWDVKRLATSVVLAARDNGFDDQVAGGAAVRAASAYRLAMSRFAGENALDVWYAQASIDLIARVAVRAAGRRQLREFEARAKRRTSQRLLSRLTETVDGRRRFRSDPPLLVPLRDLETVLDPATLQSQIRQSLAAYAASLHAEHRHLLSRFRLVDMALKVVGVGSVGTRCVAVLLEGVDHGEPLVLQAKEAAGSVLEAYLPASVYAHHGERVIQGQRLIQATSDIFLGWSGTGSGPDFYWRQLQDRKGSVVVANLRPSLLGSYAGLCGWTLAHAHARSGDAVSIAAYLGSGPCFDEAMRNFALSYAAQAENDHARFVADKRTAADAATRPPGSR
jgi:uncharacterized protein (DUF2252 family)